MKLKRITNKNLSACESIKLGNLTINTTTLTMALGRLSHNNDDYMSWAVSIEENKIIDNFIIKLKFNNKIRRIGLNTTNTLTFEVTSDCKTTDINTLKEYIIKKLFRFTEAKK